MICRLLQSHVGLDIFQHILPRSPGNLISGILTVSHDIQERVSQHVQPLQDLPARIDIFNFRGAAHPAVGGIFHHAQPVQRFGRLPVQLI